VLLGALLDLLVHPTEDLFVSSCPLSEVQVCNPPSCLGASSAPGEATHESRSRLLQQRAASLSIFLPANGPSSLGSGAALGWRGEEIPPPVDPATPVGKHAPLLVVAVRAEGDGE